MKEILDLLRKNQWSLGAVESFTGGLFAHLCTNVSGASEVFRGSLVTYQLCTKEHILGIESQTLLRYGAVSEEIAIQMAKKGQEHLLSDMTVAFTGNAGPNASERKPVGLIYIAIQFLQSTHVVSYQLSGSRESIKNQAVELAKKMISDLLTEEKAK